MTLSTAHPQCEGEDDRSLTASDTKTRPLNQAPLSDRVSANTPHWHVHRDHHHVGLGKMIGFAPSRLLGATPTN
jgi:hypothetical protein